MAKNTQKIDNTHIRSKKIKFQLELRKRLETLQELDVHQKESKTEHQAIQPIDHTRNEWHQRP